MTLDSLVATLPWGLHDAYLESLSIDWRHATACLAVRLMMSERQDQERQARIDLAGLVFCSVEPPVIDPPGGLSPTPSEGLWIDAGPGAAPGAAENLPAVPEGCFLHWIYVKDWNRFVHLCAREASLTWTSEVGPAQAETRALYPGDEIPVP